MKRRISFARIPSDEFVRFIRIVRRLRRDCPWDRKQTHRSLRETLIEETYEVIDALDRGSTQGLKQELGDLLLHIAMQATIAEQAGEFTIANVIDMISEKLVRRHPHVFGTSRLRGADEVVRSWEALKMKEGRTSALEGIPAGLPSLQRAFRVQKRASATGFDWKRPAQVWAKLEEEMKELRQATRGGNRRKQEQEFGDFLFSVVNYARFLRVNPEDALRGTVNRFVRRFQYIERSLARSGRDVHHATLHEMDALWEEAKATHKRQGRRKRPHVS